MNSQSVPRLKPLVEYWPIKQKIFFFCRPGIAIEMDDPKGFIATACKQMNGKRNIQELKDMLFALYPDETPYLENLLISLNNEYLLEDVSQNNKTTLTEHDTNRWSRNIEFFSSYCKASDNKYSYQEKLKSIKVTIMGLGGVGSNILYNLAAMGVCNLKAVDFDKVELSNLNRQIMYDTNDIDQLKSVAAKKRISAFLPNANIEFINQKISSSTDIENIIFDQDIVISAIDHPREKIMDWFNAACLKTNTSLMCGALDSRIALCYTIIPGQTGCIECWKSSAKKSTPIFQNLIQHENFIASAFTNVAIMPMISLMTGLLTTEFLKIVTNIAEPQSLGRVYTFDFLSSQTKISESWERNPDCSICQTN